MSGERRMRTEGISGECPPVRFGEFALDPARRLVTRGSEVLHLTPKAFDLLALLVHQAPRVVPKNELHALLWKDAFVSDATLVSVVKELRRVLSDRSSDRPIIRTVHRVGYAFDRALSEAEPDTSVAPHWVVVQRRRVMLQTGENVIGRDPAARVWLDSPSVSRQHARIIIDRAGVRLEDLGSKNGTKLGGRAVIGESSLRDRDWIEFGAVRILYRTSTAGGTTETRAGDTAPDLSSRAS